MACLNFSGILARIAASENNASATPERRLNRTYHVMPPPPISAADDSASLWPLCTPETTPEISQMTAASNGSSSTHQSSDSRTDADWDADFETTLATGNAAAVNRFCSLVPFTTWCSLSDAWLQSARRAGATEAVRVLRSRGAAWPTEATSDGGGAKEDEDTAAAAAPSTSQEDAAVIQEKRRLREAELYEDDSNVTVVPSPVAAKKCRVLL